MFLSIREEMKGTGNAEKKKKKNNEVFDMLKDNQYLFTQVSIVDD